MPTSTVFACPAEKPATTAALPVTAKNAGPRHHGDRPDHRDPGEVGDPVAPGLHGRDLGAREGAEDQAGDREGEDELGQALAGAVGDERRPRAP